MQCIGWRKYGDRTVTKLIKNIYKRFSSGYVKSEKQKNDSIMVHEK